MDTKIKHRDIPVTKLCRSCEDELPASRFRPDPRMKSGLYSYCRSCEATKARKWNADNPEKRAEIEARRVPRSYGQRREAVLSREYGMSLSDYRRMEESQGGLCAICGEPEPGKFGNLHVDHCHETGEVRGLLCASCNLGLGKFRDRPDLLIAASAYLEKQR